ncbi:Sec-independent protein translocase TatB [Mycetocola manganoxydans]|uniref:Sec-independent protein translocase TatB n=1 Tax=Mycetocola manganoxydans TaxID=699879 RepID=A0A3L6ZS74_9MICO|nr:Sec-independent protein translocase TatB [Mycetocola manganoxydans]RLP70796.1 Sec-independent protein translocase TatB [Mycetocola manganoxydans]GHD48275.1 sec-independent protein translocase protein TatB [Mycetocola manganoxydans]
MFFGLTFEKLLLIGVIAVFLLGPDRLPGYAAKLAQLIRSLRDMARGAKDRMRDEMGPEFDDVDWQKLDPRQYDPRRIIREALLDDSPGPAPVIKPPSSEAGAAAAEGAAVVSTAAEPTVGVSSNPFISAGAVDRSRRLAAGETVDPPPFDAEST